MHTAQYTLKALHSTHFGKKRYAGSTCAYSVQYTHFIQRKHSIVLLFIVTHVKVMSTLVLYQNCVTASLNGALAIPEMTPLRSALHMRKCESRCAVRVVFAMFL